MASLETEITVKRNHFAFLHAAIENAGWEVLGEWEGVTTDDGYDSEIKMRLRVKAPLSALANAPDHPSLRGGSFDRLLADVGLIA